MNGIFEAAEELCAFMAAQDWKFCIIGGLAVQCWGEPRTTLDVDITLLTGWGNEASYVDRLLGNFEARLKDVREFALARRILLLRASNGVDVDIALGALPMEEAMVARAVQVDFGEGRAAPVCTAEDLFIMKAFADRPRDWIDAESIAIRQASLDRAYIIDALHELAELKESPEILARARRVLETRQS
jgi:hypothetical protein